MEDVPRKTGKERKSRHLKTKKKRRINTQIIQKKRKIEIAWTGAWKIRETKKIDINSEIDSTADKKRPWERTWKIEIEIGRKIETRREKKGRRSQKRRRKKEAGGEKKITVKIKIIRKNHPTTTTEASRIIPRCGRINIEYKSNH